MLDFSSNIMIFNSERNQLAFLPSDKEARVHTAQLNTMLRNIKFLSFTFSLKVNIFLNMRDVSVDTNM